MNIPKNQTFTETVLYNFDQVWDKDSFSKDDPLGEVQMPLWLAFGPHTPAIDTWKDLLDVTSRNGKVSNPIQMVC